MALEDNEKQETRFIDHEGRIIILESKLEGLLWHHRHDNVLGLISELKLELEILQAKMRQINGNGINKKVQWLERMALIAIGALLAIEYIVRIVSSGKP